MWSNFFDSQNQTSSSVDDCLEPNDAVLWQASKGDIAVIDSAQDQTLHHMTSRVLRERPRNRPQLSVDCEAGPHKSRDMRRHYRSLSRTRPRSRTSFFG